MARYQLIGSLLLLAILAVSCTAQASSRRLRFGRLRQVAFARQEVAPTPYPAAADLKPAPQEPALTYGAPQDSDVDLNVNVNALPEEQVPAVDNFEPNPEAEDVDTEESSLEITTPTAASAPARLRSRQRLAKLQVAPAKRQRQVQRTARLEELTVQEAVAPVPAPAAPQFYYVGAQQQPYVLAYSAAPQQLGW
ncbi:fibrous sheath CABYR-binding protein [Drosophila obscura]|uniref:fibrous sheath CABYR-binding protein n=1 Tax=Drosophila obscura TaxID=7282 RepID=UPI001BB2C2D0|nr:fibrous sheath CABYR-binding protein [Drosophila obscura]